MLLMYELRLETQFVTRRLHISGDCWKVACANVLVVVVQEPLKGKGCQFASTSEAVIKYVPSGAGRSLAAGLVRQFPVGSINETRNRLQF